MLKLLCERLSLLYSSENLGNKTDPTEELFFLILTTKTSYKNYEKCFNRLKALLSSWDDILRVPREKIEEAIQPCGLHKKKSHIIQEIARHLKTFFGAVSLEAIRSWPTEEAESFLLRLPGVGPKVAKALLMYSLGRDVLPVDTHTYRVAYRLGLISKMRDLRNERGQLHRELEKILSPACRRVFHVGAVVIGRHFCLPRKPKCFSCPISGLCPKQGL